MGVPEAGHGEVEIAQLCENGSGQNDAENKRKPVAKLGIALDSEAQEGTEGLGADDGDTSKQGADANVNENILAAEGGAMGEVDEDACSGKRDEYEDDEGRTDEQAGDSVCV